MTTHDSTQSISSLPETMQGIIFSKGRPCIKTFCLPVPADNEALVRVTMAGICNTDMEIARGYADHKGIPGHEWTGIVVSCPKEPGLCKSRVVADINIGCMECHTCKTLGPRHCPQRKVIGIRGRDGAFAQYIRVPVANLYEVPSSVSDMSAVFAEPLAAVLRITTQTDISAYKRIAILGDGKMGLLCALVFSVMLSDAKITLFGRHEKNLNKAVSTITDIVRIPRGDGSSHQAIPQKYKEYFDLVVEATGNPKASWMRSISASRAVR